MVAGNNEQCELVVDIEGSDKEGKGGKGDGEWGWRATKRVRAAEILGDLYAKKSPLLRIGIPFISLSPQAFLATEFWASLAYSIGYHLLTSILEEYH
jgi:hypothetical protein